MAIRVGINGLGRIGRLIFRQILDLEDYNILYVNDLVSPKLLAYLLQYDSVHGTWDQKVYGDDNFLYVGEKRIQVFSSPNPEDLPHREMQTDFLIESTGCFTSMESAGRHVAAGASQVIVTAPSSDIPMYVFGVNHHKMNPEGEKIISNASCTTNCLAVIAKVLQDSFGIEEGLMTTVHAVTATQRTVDAPAKKDFRGSRGILGNIIPSSTGAAKAVGSVIPELQDKLTGMAFRVPTPDVSVVDLTVRLERPTSLDDIHKAMQEAASANMQGILSCCDHPSVSTDFIGSPYSAIFDKDACIQLNSHLHKIIAWYDNEYGYAKRVCDLMQHLAMIRN